MFFTRSMSSNAMREQRSTNLFGKNARCSGTWRFELLDAVHVEVGQIGETSSGIAGRFAGKSVPGTWPVSR